MGVFSQEMTDILKNLGDSEMASNPTMVNPLVPLTASPERCRRYDGLSRPLTPTGAVSLTHY